MTASNTVHIPLNGDQVAVRILDDSHFSAIELRCSTQVVQLNSIANFCALQVKIERARLKVKGGVELSDQALRTRRKVCKGCRAVRSNLISGDTSDDVTFSGRGVTDSIAKYKKARSERAFNSYLEWLLSP